MDLGLISVRYARALLKAGIETGQSEKVYADMQTLAGEYIHVPELATAIHNPMLSREQKKSLFMTAVGDKPCNLTERFFDLVLQEGREGILQFIANSYITLFRKHNNLVSARVTTATTLTPDTEARMRQLVENKTDGTVEFVTEVDPDIIGGFVLEYNTYRLDASVKSQLNTILSQLN